jgi:hypothetical protein
MRYMQYLKVKELIIIVGGEDACCDNFSGTSSLKFRGTKGSIGHTFMVCIHTVKHQSSLHQAKTTPQEFIDDSVKLKLHNSWEEMETEVTLHWQKVMNKNKWEWKRMLKGISLSNPYLDILNRPTWIPRGLELPRFGWRGASQRI